MATPTARSGLLRANLTVAAGTAISRITGVVRIIVFGVMVGQTALADAYDAANNAPNVVYELLLGGILTATLVPLFTRQMQDGDDDALSAISSVADMTGARLIRLQCYEGLDESKALYEWNYKKQLLRIQADKTSDSWSEVHDDIFSEEFLLTRPLLEAITSEEPVVLLIDEVDRVEVETEALLLEILSEYQVSIPELGTITAKQIPLVFLTSNNTRELSEALKRRCLYLHVDYPDLEREKEIVLNKVPDISENLADQIARIVRSIRQLDLKKAPSVSETLDWARTLMLLGIETIDEKEAKETLHILLKYQTDIAKAAKELSVTK